MASSTVSLPAALNNILNKQWTRINDFYTQFVFPSGTHIKTIPDADLQVALKSITLPAYTQQSIEVYTGGQWMVANGRPDLFRIECTFRDYKGSYGGVASDFVLYRGFVDLFEKTLGDYKDNCYVSLNILTGEDGSSPALAKFNDLLIENVSQINFDNTIEDQIAEFSVTFRGRHPKVDSARYYDKVGSSFI